MKLRFKIDQAEALRQGIDAPTSVVTIEVDPHKLTQEERALLADRMDGIDLRELYRPFHFECLLPPSERGKVHEPVRSDRHITADRATLAALMVAVRENEEQVRLTSQSKSDSAATCEERQGAK